MPTQRISKGHSASSESEVTSPVPTDPLYQGLINLSAPNSDWITLHFLVCFCWVDVTVELQVYKCIHASQCDNENIQSTDCIIDYNCYNNPQCLMHSSINQNRIAEPGLLFLSVLLFNWHVKSRSIIFMQTSNWFWWIYCAAWYKRALCAKQATGSAFTAFCIQELSISRPQKLFLWQAVLAFIHFQDMNSWYQQLHSWYQQFNCWYL